MAINLKSYDVVVEIVTEGPFECFPNEGFVDFLRAGRLPVWVFISVQVLNL